MAMFAFPEHVPDIFGVFLCACARDDAIGGTMEDSDNIQYNNFIYSRVQYTISYELFFDLDKYVIRT